MMRYGSVSSGIECAAMAWAPLGWSPAFLAEIDPFACHVLHHHHGSGRPRHMPSPDAEGVDEKERRKRAAAIRAVRDLPERTNGVPNFGDMTTFEEWPDADIDLLVGGTPCQSYSVAGLRKGLDDPRGDLTLTYAAIARRFRPRWLVWENVAGILSHDRGRSFASLLGLLSGRRVEVPKGGWQSAGVVEGYRRAYGLAWIVRDTQYARVDGFERAIPQRRRRVFVVGYLGDWRRAAAVLFEREGLSGHPPPRRDTSEEPAETLAGGARSRGGYSYDDVPLVGEAFGGNRQSGSIDVATTLTSHDGPVGRLDFETETFVMDVAPTLDASYGRLRGQSGQDANHGHGHLVSTRAVAATLTRGAESAGKGGCAGRRQEDDVNLVAHTLLAKGNDSHAADIDTYVAHTLRGEGFDASEDGSGRGVPIVPVSMAFRGREGGAAAELGDDVAFTLRASSGGGDKPYVLIPDVAGALCRESFTGGAGGRPEGAAAGHFFPIAFNSREDCEVTFDRSGPLGASSPQAQAVAVGWGVRRLTPRECCRLQGVPDDYFDTVVWRGKSPPPDGPIYKALGNGFSVNVVRWIGRRIGRRIEMVEALFAEEREVAT